MIITVRYFTVYSSVSKVNRTETPGLPQSFFLNFPFYGLSFFPVFGSRRTPTLPLRDFHLKNSHVVVFPTSYQFFPSMYSVEIRSPGLLDWSNDKDGLLYKGFNWIIRLIGVTNTSLPKTELIVHTSQSTRCTVQFTVYDEF